VSSFLAMSPFFSGPKKLTFYMCYHRLGIVHINTIFAIFVFIPNTMGYTHYFTNEHKLAPIDEATLVFIKRVIEKHKDILCLEYDTPDKPPKIQNDVLQFNGKGDDGHETFYFTLKKGFSFVKTARKPYDLPVCVVLKLLEKCYGDAFSLGSDGFEDDWEDATREYEQLINEGCGESKRQREDDDAEEDPVLVQKMNQDAPIPKRQKKGDAGYDLTSLEAFTVKAGEIKTVPVGLAFGIPDGYYGQIMSRSSLAVQGLVVLGEVIDQGYTGEVSVILQNCNREKEIEVKAMDRIAQIVFIRMSTSPLLEVKELPKTVRGAEGFGSTGTGQNVANN